MRIILMLLTFAAVNLLAQEDQGSQMKIESQLCDFDGKKLSLSGSIAVD